MEEQLLLLGHFLLFGLCMVVGAMFAFSSKTPELLEKWWVVMLFAAFFIWIPLEILFWMLVWVF
tara:strand:+ start:204 stop:395 length:192 start_codon:yes stop_codon:yes gene_type:complete